MLNTRHFLLEGNTSACAEKRYCSKLDAFRPWKYLRVRGEEGVIEEDAQILQEIPPRARRRVLKRQVPIVSLGNTSACAEKSYRSELNTMNAVEIPPRARRRDPRDLTLTV